MPISAAASPGALTRWEGLRLLLYAQGSYEEMVTLGRSLARAGRAAGNGSLSGHTHLRSGGKSRRLPFLPRPGTAGTTLGFAQTV